MCDKQTNDDVEAPVNSSPEGKTTSKGIPALPTGTAVIATLALVGFLLLLWPKNLLHWPLNAFLLFGAICLTLGAMTFCYFDTLKRKLYNNWLALLTLLASIVLFAGVPQLRFVWYSQTPGLDAPSWLLWWLLFAIVLFAGLVFFGVSFYVVPRRIHPLPKDAGKWSRYVLGPFDKIISWPIAVRKRLGRPTTAGFGLTLAATVYVLYPDHAPTATLFTGIPLSGITCHHACLWLFAFGAWLLLSAVAVTETDTKENVDALSAEGSHPIVITFGRLLGWLFLLYLLDEATWLLCAADVFSLRVYAMLALLFLLMLAGVIAGSLDVLDLHLDHVPVRFIGLAALLLAALAVRPAVNSDVALLPRDPKLGFSTAIDGTGFDDAYHHLEMRIRAIPEGEPVVFVAASGGGSRAAIFTALVYEYLSRRPLGSRRGGAGQPRTWADNIALISSVSGGSLATAHFVRRSCATSDVTDLKFTIPAELYAGVRAEITRLIGEANPDPNDPLWAKVKQRAEALSTSLEGGAQASRTDRWTVENEFVDEMCMNFMAPILRGANAVPAFRGDALGSFWDDVFSWSGCNNLTGYALPNGTPDSAWYAPGRQPVVLFNSCNVEDGSRVVVGFPPLPADAFDVEAARGSRFPPQGLALAHESHHISTSLSNAVRFSANFPWGFNSCVIELPAENGRDGVTMKLMDGGVSDNTGIDTIFELIKGLQRTDNARGQRLLRLLKRRPLVLLEIDSGAKPTPTGLLHDVLGTLTEPMTALSNAAYNNADIAKQNYVAAINGMLAREQTPDDETAEPEAAADNSDNAPSPAATVAGPMMHLTVRCNHFDRDNPDLNEVMTAWALSPQQKASVVARFVLELELLESKLKKIESAVPQFEKARELVEMRDPAQAAQRFADALEARRDESMRLNANLSKWEAAAGRRPAEQHMREFYWNSARLEEDVEEARETFGKFDELPAAQRNRIRRLLSAAEREASSNKSQIDNFIKRERVDLESGIGGSPSNVANNMPADRLDVKSYETLTRDPVVAPPEIENDLKSVQENSRTVRQSLKSLEVKGRNWFPERPAVRAN